MKFKTLKDEVAFLRGQITIKDDKFKMMKRQKNIKIEELKNTVEYYFYKLDTAMRGNGKFDTEEGKEETCRSTK